MHFTVSLITLLPYCLHVTARTISISSSTEGDALLYVPGTHVTIRHSASSQQERIPFPRWRSEVHRPLKKRLSLADSNSSVHYDAADISYSRSAGLNSSQAFNGTKVDAVSAPGLEAVFGQSTSTDSTTEEEPVTDATYQNLLRYVKFCAAAYVQQCSAPNNATFVQSFGSLSSSQTTGLSATSLGYIARDDSSQELIVAFQGDPSMQSVPSVFSSGSSLVDASAVGPADSLINTDLLTTFTTNRATLSQTLQSQLETYADYGITFTGHGSGGALAIIAGVSMTSSLGSDVPMQVITFGAPRVGNDVWANYTESTFLQGTLARHLRVTHTDDNIPQILTQTDGYHHAAVELYESDSGVNATSMIECVGAEDPGCNLGQTTSTVSTNLATNDVGSVVASAVPAAPSSLSGIQGTLDPAQLDSGTSAIASPDTGTTSSASTADNAGLVSPVFSSAPASQATFVSSASSLDQGTVPCSSCLGTECIDCVDDSETTSDSSPSTTGTGAESTTSTLAEMTDPSTGLTYAQEMQNLENDVSTMQISDMVDASTGMTYAQELELLESQLQTPVSESQAQSSAYTKHKRAASDGVASGVANAAHMMYLGIQMNEDGPTYCKALPAAAAADQVTKVPTNVGVLGSLASIAIAASSTDAASTMTSDCARQDRGSVYIVVMVGMVSLMDWILWSVL